MMTLLSDEQLFDAIKELRGQTWKVGGAFYNYTATPSFAQIGTKLRTQGFKRADGSEIDDDTVRIIYRAQVPKG